MNFCTWNPQWREHGYNYISMENGNQYPISVQYDCYFGESSKVKSISKNK